MIEGPGRLGTYSVHVESPSEGRGDSVLALGSGF